MYCSHLLSSCDHENAEQLSTLSVESGTKMNETLRRHAGMAKRIPVDPGPGPNWQLHHIRASVTVNVIYRHTYPRSSFEWAPECLLG